MKRKKALLCVLLLALLLLQACAPVLNRSYSSQKPHPQYSDADMDTGYLRAESFQQLVSAILFLVAQGDSTGLIRLYNYSGPAESDLDAAYWEVIETDPLGAYAVDYIKYELRKAVSYYEVELTIAYRRSPEQIAALVAVTGPRALPGELVQLMPGYPEEAVFRVSYFDQNLDEEDIRRTALAAYDASPASAVGRPGITVALYPAEGGSRQRMVEILFDYPYTREEMLTRAATLARRLAELPAFSAEDSPAARFAQVVRLMNALERAQDGGNDAYAALVEGRADDEGQTLAAALLCSEAALPFQVIRGTKQGEARVWLLVTLEEEALHWEPGQDAPKTAADMAAAGYQWE